MFEDSDDSGDDIQVDDLRMRHGWSTTEDWRFEYDGLLWWAYGSRSGKQARPFETGERWSSDNKEIVLALLGTATEGDRVSFRTDTGVREHDKSCPPYCASPNRPHRNWAGTTKPIPVHS